MKRFTVTVNGVAYDVTVEENASGVAAPVAVPTAAPAPKAPAASKPAAPASAGGVQVKSPLQGTVMKILVKVGDSVKKGTPVCVVEALKMENDVPAPEDGVVASIEVKSGDSVQADAVLLTLN